VDTPTLLIYETNLELAGTQGTMGHYKGWWRRRESNPRPKKATAKSLHA